MDLRRPLGLLYALGLLGWPLGVFGFGGFDDDTGATIVLAGGFLVLGSMAVELLLRWRDKRRTTKAATTGHDRHSRPARISATRWRAAPPTLTFRRKEKRDRDVTGVPRRMELDSDGAATAFRQTGVGGSRPSLAFATLLGSRHALLRARGAPLTAHSRARTAR